VVADATTWQTIATLSGAPSFLRLFCCGPAVTPFRDSFAAALEDAASCQGTALYVAIRQVACVAGATGAEFSPDGTKVALARNTGKTGPIQAPGYSAVSSNQFDIVLVDVATGAERVVAHGAVGEEHPLISWNQAGTHVLVRWPASYGL
jgi:hypothetical protein